MTDDEKEKPSEEIEYLPDSKEPGKGHPDEPPVSGPTPAEGEEPVHPADEAPAEGAKPLKDKLRKKDAEIKHLKKELEELRERHVRALAETENIRKRLEREKNDYFQFALSDLLLEFLNILDNFERALQASEGDADGKTFREGIDLIYRMSMNLLHKRGVRPIEIKDGTFDPTLHHAMVREESADVDEPRVTEELQKGYMLHNRLLRPALVKVVVPKKE
jgi:molecular chaperone GrpE